MNKSILKAIITLVVYLLFVVVWGVSLVMFILEESVVWANIWVFSSIIVLISVFYIDASTKNYKLKYYFLGKEFKKQRDNYFAKHIISSKKDKKDMLKSMKHNYRVFGNVEYVYNSYSVTPIGLYGEDFYSFNYGNALQKQKIEYVVYALYSKCLEGGGLYRFFELVAEEPFTFEEYARVVKDSELPTDLKRLLCSKDCKKVFEYTKNFDNLTDKEHEFMENFELNESDKVYDYQNEIFDLVEKIAMANFVDYHKDRHVPDNATKIYYSKDQLKRVSICFSEELNSYTVVRQELVFLEEDFMHSEAGWSEQRGVSYFETEELALNEIKNEIKEYVELILN